MVSQFYTDVGMLPVMTDQEMGSAMQQLSAQQAEEFDTVAALKELYIYVTKYREPVSCLLQGRSDKSYFSIFCDSCWRRSRPIPFAGG